MIEIVFPEDWSERMAFFVAAITVLIGLAAMVMPKRIGQFMGLAQLAGSRHGLSEIRGPIGGMWVGVGLACLLLGQPFSYFVLGLGYAFAVVGRFISMVFDRAWTPYCLIATVVELLATYFPLRFALEGFGLL